MGTEQPHQSCTAQQHGPSLGSVPQLQSLPLNCSYWDARCGLQTRHCPAPWQLPQLAAALTSLSRLVRRLCVTHWICQGRGWYTRYGRGSSWNRLVPSWAPKGFAAGERREETNRLSCNSTHLHCPQALVAVPAGGCSAHPPGTTSELRGNAELTWVAQTCCPGRHRGKQSPLPPLPAPKHALCSKAQWAFMPPAHQTGQLKTLALASC